MSLTQQHNETILLTADHYSPVFLEYSLMKEFVHLQQQSPSGLYVVPSHSSPFRWFAVLFVDTGIYRGAVIRFTLQIPFDYPNCGPPNIFFEPIVLHPLINPKNGELISKYTFPDWICHERRISELFLFVKAMFTDLEIVLKEQLIEEDSSDSVAVFYATNFLLFKNNLSEFKRKVSESVDECRNKLYEIHSDDRNAINFGPWSPEIHEELRKKLISGQNITEVDETSENRSDCRSGLSWVQKGSSQMFSKFNC